MWVESNPTMLDCDVRSFLNSWGSMPSLKAHKVGLILRVVLLVHDLVSPTIIKEIKIPGTIKHKCDKNLWRKQQLHKWKFQ